jgi:hypothetical protein
MTALFHPYWTDILGIVTLAIWLHLFFGRGWFWRVKSLDADADRGLPQAVFPKIIAVVPARNEAETIGKVVTSLVNQDYPGAFSIVVVTRSQRGRDAAIVPGFHGTWRGGKFALSPPWPPWLDWKLWALNEGLLSPPRKRPHSLVHLTRTSPAPSTCAGRGPRRTEQSLTPLPSWCCFRRKPAGTRLIPAFLFLPMLYPPG